MKKPTLRRPRFATGAVAGLACAGLLGTGLALATSHSAEAAPGPTATPIQHLVVIFDENVAFDHYFGTYPHAANTDGVRFTAAAGTPTPKNLVSDHAITTNPNSTKPFRLTYKQAATCSQNHGYTAEQQAMNWVGGRALMNKFPQYTSHDSCTGRLGRAGLAMGHYDGNTVTGEWNYAQNFTLSDNFWANGFGPSTPGALEIVSGQTWGATAYTSTSDDSFPTPASPATASGLSAVNPATGVGTLIADPDPVYDDCANNNHTSGSNVVGMQGQNIGDLLNAQGITWGWFQGGFTPTTPYAGAGSYAQCSAAHTTIAGNSVRDYSPHHNPFAYYQSTSNPHHLPPSSDAMIGSTDQANHQYDLSDFSTALAQDNLPAVSYLKAPAYQDGHQGSSDPIDEQHFLVSTINKIQQSPSWPSTAIIVTYDDSDGSYDHVAPRIINGSRTSDDAAICKAGPVAMLGQQDRCGPSQRLPFLLISPFARKNYIDHTLISQASVVRFIEDNWGLGQIGNGSYDATAASLRFLFDFQHPQQRSVLLNANGALYSVQSVAVGPAGGSVTTLSAPAASGTYGKAAGLSASATSAGDVTGGIVTTTIDGKAGPSLPMYSSYGTLRLLATLPAGRHTVKLSFSGSADTLPASTTTTVTVAKASATIRAKAAKARQGKVRITVTVAESGSSVRPTGTISGTVNGKRLRAVPVRNGVAHLTVKVRKGKNKVVLGFTSPDYRPAKRALTVKG